MTLKELAQNGEVTEEMKICAQNEDVSEEYIREELTKGEIVICRNKKGFVKKFCAIGKGLKTKINVNIGTSKDRPNVEEELEKLQVALKYGADTIMDLSTGGNLDEIRKVIRENCPVPLGTVPIYQAAIEAVEKHHKSIVEMTVSEIFKVIEKQAEDGIDFMTVHCGVTKESLQRLKNKERILGVVSRGGSFLAEWIIYNNKENPLYEHYDELLEIARTYDVTLSLGDGLRPGCIADATDEAQIQELILLGELTLRAWDKGVQVMIEGPGHVPLDQIETNVKLQKKLCHGAPFYVLGPLPTDIAPGYDHLVGAIGGAIAASAGADFLCYLTPAEHLRLPTIDDVREGTIASKIAAHIGDLVKGIKSAWEWDLKMAKARAKLDWEEQIELSIDPEKARRYRIEGGISKSKACSMCGPYCAIKIFEEAFKFLKGNQH
ncbi:phosphomethylpyrimidine synthase ThiC [Thermodesulfobacterium hydrogeniphilum]|uniref:phosphomethylpyrimidine synthase ThiC n=1 Tax=Thermodesulfobacterium hydrogeniphilum TaxID=161156 RepID=UPI0005716ABC|nr:phosphomethylpyrimidine synthase ThiC [Thermodesulfobacterium hydrogeniphilum]